ncbi:hypothetical protein [Hymenobacter algoricola]|uniref:hypothetical protein n=1 Tax=Hymenobacter algoricola TaxID=486267 RepID=UPI0031EEEDC8
MLVGTGGCQVAEKKEVAVLEDYENHPDNVWITNEKVHSGNWACKITPQNVYGPGITRSWELLGHPTRLRVSAWVIMPHGRATAALVVEAKRDNATIYYRLLPIEQVVKRYNQWEQVYDTFTLPETMAPTDVVKVYLWQIGEKRNTIYMDDLMLETLF